MATEMNVRCLFYYTAQRLNNMERHCSNILNEIVVSIFIWSKQYLSNVVDGHENVLFEIIAIQQVAARHQTSE
ncbi:hypothetical protein M0804_012628 [Polistes exclamans]|nr:hypothetical protein M0804_012628 [Polistes exclamans]